MRKIVGFCENTKFNVGLTGSVMYVFDKEDNILAEFKGNKYAYRGSFKPSTNIFMIKSTDGYLRFYDLDELQEIKNIHITKRGAQDNGFAFSPDGKLLYNISNPVSNLETQLDIYDTETFELKETLFDTDKKLVINHLEYDVENSRLLVLGYFRGKDGVYSQGFIGVIAENEIIEIRNLEKPAFDYLCRYKSCEACGFTEEKLKWSYIGTAEEVVHTSLKEAYSGKFDTGFLDK